MPEDLPEKHANNTSTHAMYYIREIPHSFFPDSQLPSNSLERKVIFLLAPDLLSIIKHEW